MFIEHLAEAIGHGVIILSKYPLENGSLRKFIAVTVDCHSLTRTSSGTTVAKASLHNVWTDGKQVLDEVRAALHHGDICIIQRNCCVATSLYNGCRHCWEMKRVIHVHVFLVVAPERKLRVDQSKPQAGPGLVLDSVILHPAGCMYRETVLKD